MTIPCDAPLNPVSQAINGSPTWRISGTGRRFLRECPPRAFIRFSPQKMALLCGRGRSLPRPWSRRWRRERTRWCIMPRRWAIRFCRASVRGRIIHRPLPLPSRTNQSPRQSPSWSDRTSRWMTVSAFSAGMAIVTWARSVGSDASTARMTTFTRDWNWYVTLYNHSLHLFNKLFMICNSKGKILAKKIIIMVSDHPNMHMINWLIDWLVDWLIDWLIGRLIDWLIGWSVDWLIDWLHGCGLDFCVVRKCNRFIVGDNSSYFSEIWNLTCVIGIGCLFFTTIISSYFFFRMIPWAMEPAFWTAKDCLSHSPITQCLRSWTVCRRWRNTSATIHPRSSTAFPATVTWPNGKARTCRRRRRCNSPPSPRRHPHVWLPNFRPPYSRSRRTVSGTLPRCPTAPATARCRGIPRQTEHTLPWRSWKSLNTPNSRCKWSRPKSRPKNRPVPIREPIFASRTRETELLGLRWTNPRRWRKLSSRTRGICTRGSKGPTGPLRPRRSARWMFPWKWPPISTRNFIRNATEETRMLRRCIGVTRACRWPPRPPRDRRPPRWDCGVSIRGRNSGRSGAFKATKIPATWTRRCSACLPLRMCLTRFCSGSGARETSMVSRKFRWGIFLVSRQQNIRDQRRLPDAFMKWEFFVRKIHEKIGRFSLRSEKKISKKKFQKKNFKKKNFKISKNSARGPFSKKWEWKFEKSAKFRKVFPKSEILLWNCDLWSWIEAVFWCGRVLKRR